MRSMGAFLVVISLLAPAASAAVPDLPVRLGIEAPRIEIPGFLEGDEPGTYYVELDGVTVWFNVATRNVAELRFDAEPDNVYYATTSLAADDYMGQWVTVITDADKNLVRMLSVSHAWTDPDTWAEPDNPEAAVEVIDYGTAQRLSATHHRGELLSTNFVVGGSLTGVLAEDLTLPFDTTGEGRVGAVALGLILGLALVFVLFMVSYAGCRFRWYNPFTYGCP